MSARSADELDAELTRRVDEQARIADALVELERHPGHRLLATAALTGVTAARWAATQELLAALWADLATHRAVVADACAVRTRRPRPGEREWAELHELLAACPVARRHPARDRRSASWVTGWAAGSARSPRFSKPWRRCTSRRWPVSARWPSGCATPRSAGASCWSRTTRPPRRSRRWSPPSTPGSPPARTIRCRSRPGCHATSSTVWPAAAVPTAASTRSRPAWRSVRRPGTAGRPGTARPPTRSRPSTRCTTGRPRPAARRWTASQAQACRCRPTPGPRCAEAGRAAHAATGRGIPHRVAPPRRGRRRGSRRRARRSRACRRPGRPSDRARRAVRRLPGQGVAARGVRRPGGHRARRAGPRPAGEPTDRPARTHSSARRLPAAGERSR